MPCDAKSKNHILHLKAKLTPFMKKLYCLQIRIAFTCILFLNIFSIWAQDSLQNNYTDISKIFFQRRFDKTILSTYIGNKDDLSTVYPSLRFTPGLKHKGTVPNEFVTQKIVLKFNVCNTSNSVAAVYFFPGFYFQNISLYRLRDQNIERIPSIMPRIADSIGYRLISLPAGDSATLLAELDFVKTYNNVIRPRFINTGYLSAFIAELRTNYSRNNLITYVFCGLMLMMILFSIANFLQGANPEFLYYSGYALFLGGMLFTQAVFSSRTTYLSFFLEGYLDFIMQGLGIMFYMLFMRQFLDTKNKHPFLYKLYNFGIFLITVSLFAYTLAHYFSNNYSLVNLIENITKVSLLLMTLVFLIYSFRYWKDKLLRYLFWGNLFLFVFALVSQLAILFDAVFKQFPGVFRSSLIYYEIGLLLELVLFLAGLNHKNRRQLITQTKERETLKAQNLLQEYEKEIAVYKAQQEERQRISADMHDELGAGMTAIRLMSEIARNKMKENTPVEINKISSSADDVLNKMNAIIWSMNSGNDTLDNLIFYIRTYALEYFDNTPVECQVNVPENIPDVVLAGDKRRNIFLCVKETLNNSLKHSGASLLTIDITANHHLQVKITDNGKGIDMQNLRQFGNGLRNINRRMESIGGFCKIESNNGAVTTLELPL